MNWNITYHYVNLSTKVLSLVSYRTLKSVGLRHSALNESITRMCMRVCRRRATRRGAAAQLIDWLILELKCDAAAVAIVTHTLLGNCSWCLPFRWPAAVPLTSYCVKLAASISLWLLESARSNTVKPSWSMFYSLCDSVRTSLSVAWRKCKRYCHVSCDQLKWWRQIESAECDRIVHLLQALVVPPAACLSAHGMSQAVCGRSRRKN